MKKTKVSNRLQKNYSYDLVEPAGENFNSDFKPQLTPQEMISLGVFGGFYDTVNNNEFPKEWFKDDHLSYARKDPDRNFFKVSASLSLSEWKKKGWIYDDDPQGWFLWYCRYYIGRRLQEEDNRQIKRWRAMVRHVAQIKKNCKKGDLTCRPKQRQALLHWAYDSRGM